MIGKLIKKTRIVPVAIFVAILVLGVRVGNIWQNLAIHEATAAPSAPNPTAAKPTPAPVAASAAPSAASATAPAPVAAAAPKDSMASANAGNADTRDMPLPIDFTDSEIGLLQHLSQRREELDKRAREMELREGLLKATEKRLDDKIAKLGELQASLQGLLKQYDTKTDAQLKSLVKTYETMKPKDAARIWDQLDMPVLIQLVENMREQKAAPILAAMSPANAKRITDELIRRRQLPGSTLGAKG